jgi:hypothetical protein
MMDERTCQKWLAGLWLGCGTLIFIVMVAQDSRQVYGAESERAWAWFKTTILPTASLIVGALAYGSRNRRSADRSIDRLTFQVSLGMSALYLFLAVAIVLLSGMVGLTPIEAIISSNRWLPLLQGLVGLSLGGFFVARNVPDGRSRSRKSSDSRRRPANAPGDARMNS